MARKKRHPSRLDESIARCIRTAQAYRIHLDSPRQREEAATDLALDEGTFREWENEARRMGWLGPNE